MAKWYKGNIHTHTTKSDGDEDPEKVCEWFENHGYDFLVLSDHNHLTILDHGELGRTSLTLIPGEEVTAFASSNMAPVHIGAIGIKETVKPLVCEDIVGTLQVNIDSIVEAGGIACINHPNFRWAFDHREMIKTHGACMFEVHNAAGGSHNAGGFGKFSTSEMWDYMLSHNKIIYGAATDDSHNYHDFSPEMYNPGRGWIMVRSKSNTPSELVHAMEDGNFYSSTGVLLDDLGYDAEKVYISIQQQADCLYHTKFIGENGLVLKEDFSNNPHYEFQENDIYVRAEVIDSDSGKAWTQPYFIE